MTSENTAGLVLISNITGWSVSGTESVLELGIWRILRSSPCTLHGRDPSMKFGKKKKKVQHAVC